MADLLARVGTPQSMGVPPPARDVRQMSTATDVSAAFAKQQREGIVGGAGKRMVKKGWVIKQGGASGSLFSRESWKKRWMVLEEKRLIWFEDENSLPKGGEKRARARRGAARRGVRARQRCGCERARSLSLSRRAHPSHPNPHLAVRTACACFFAEVYVAGATIEADPPETSKGHKFSFAVRHSERTLFARAESAEEARSWVEALQRTARGDF
eukprot:4614395-Prymnesium_polylepis.1